MLIPLSYVDKRPSTAWQTIYRATWWLTLVVAALGFITAPWDVFPSDDVLRPQVGLGDRFANVIVIVLAQNVVLAFLLFAAHVVQLLESSIQQSDGFSIPTATTPSLPPAPRLEETPGATAVPQVDSVDGPKPTVEEEAAGIWYCGACRTRNGQFDDSCWKCRDPKPEG
jgi:hypothetical protein